jgi:hypothetical protein
MRVLRYILTLSAICVHSQSVGNLPTVGQTSPVDGIALVEAVRAKMRNVVSLVDAQAREVGVAFELSTKSVEHVEANEDSRQACLMTYNGGATSLNVVLTGMTMGVRQINNAIDVASSVRQTVDADIAKLNRNIDIMNDFMGEMEDWVKFVETETGDMLAANDNLLTWGESTKETVNAQEVAIVKLGQSVYTLETDILAWQESINAIGRIFDYQPNTLSVPEAAVDVSAGTSSSLWA